MNHIGLFEGIGGFSLAARWMGWETIAWCEWNPFCQKVLNYHFPKAKQHGDITTTDFTIYRGQCDILTGGFPCQPYSVAGKRLGKEDERHLWPHMLKAIREIKPYWVVGENVPGLINWNGGMVFDEVQTDLEMKGTKSSRLYFQLAVSTRRTKGIGFGLLPTARTRGLLGGTGSRETMESCVKEGQFTAETATAMMGVKLKGLLKTPCKMDGEVSSGKKNPKSGDRSDFSPSLPGLLLRTGETSQLNPLFVMEMMGFPPDWTELPFLSGETNQ